MASEARGGGRRGRHGTKKTRGVKGERGSDATVQARNGDGMEGEGRREGRGVMRRWGRGQQRVCASSPGVGKKLYGC